MKYGCPEIVAGFCRADDEAYGHMHPKLKWGRTKTLGQGGDCCDFCLKMYFFSFTKFFCTVKIAMFFAIEPVFIHLNVF